MGEVNLVGGELRRREENFKVEGGRTKVKENLGGGELGWRRRTSRWREGKREWENAGRESQHSSFIR